MALVLGVGSSSRSTKVELRDADSGEVLASGRADHQHAPGAVSEQDPAIWWNGLVDARRDAGGALGVSTISVAAQTHGLVVVDGDGQLIRPAKLRADRDASRDAQLLVDALGGPAEWSHACGSMPTAAFSVAKLAWL